jgi:hypothetical protein
VRDDPAVLNAHRRFLFARDYAFISIVLLILLGAAAIAVVRPASTVVTYLLLLVAQAVLAIRAAKDGGRRLVATVLALKGASN